MTVPPHDLLTQYLDMVLPIPHVLSTARSFLADCQWKLEIDEKIIHIPPEIEFVVRSRAFVKADDQGVFLDDHFEAVVLIGQEAIGQSARAMYGVLRLYFDTLGQFVSEDRYDRHQ